MAKKIRTFRDAMALWGSPALLAFDLGVKDARPVVWKHRDSIPSKYWGKMTVKAKKHGYPLTLEILAGLTPGAAKA